MIKSKEVFLHSMKISNLIKILFLTIALSLIFDKAHSQTNKTNYSDIRIDALNDSKIRDFMNEVEISGLDLDQIGEVALSRGMSPGEVVKLKARVEKIRNEDAKLLRESRLSRSMEDSTKRIGIDTLTGLKRAEVENESERALSTLKSKIFGSGIFKNTQLTFEPNFKIATPRNYRVGADDELIVDIYGLSEANYVKTVSPDGTISIPYAGVVQVSGLSLDEISQKLTRSLASIYTGIRNGNTFVRVSTGKLRSIKVTILGSVTKPGTYTLSSVSTVFAALYASGGPIENGSYREIEVIREDKVIAKLDVYDFLLKGEQSKNITLKDQDIVRIPLYKTRVEVTGEVKRPGIFEILPGESLNTVLSFAGGFNDNAYQARIKVFQNTLRERKLIDVEEEDFNIYFPKSGDKYIIEPILDRFENRVKIEGAVFRPGEYQLEPGLSLKSLIQKADGLKDNAFITRGYINRIKNDGTPELISFNPSKILNSSNSDIFLKREDIVTIPSIFDLKDEFSVSIDGEVRNPGQFYYADNMSLEDLILQAGGLKEGASLSRIEIARRVNNSNKDKASAESAEIFQMSIDESLTEKVKGFVLKPFDIVSVRKSEGYEIQKQVRIEGEVKYPGIYFIARKNERISDLVQRAGGPSILAYTKGASLNRSYLKTETKILDKSQKSENEALSVLNTLKIDKDSTSSLQGPNLVNNLIGINLERILLSPGSDIDITLEEGDIVTIPKQPQTVKVSGNVLLPVTAVYTPRKNFKSYISESGGFKKRAVKSSSYVKYANGSVKSTRKLFFFFNNYPNVRPGAEIVVPTDEVNRGITLGEIISSTTGLISFGLLIVTLLK